MPSSVNVEAVRVRPVKKKRLRALPLESPANARFWQSFESDEDDSASRRYARIRRASRRYAMRQQSRKEHAYELFKRFLDIVITFPVLVLLSPLLLGLGLATKLHDGGPMFFKQVRVGRFGIPFVCYKIRTMVPNADAMKQQILDLNDHGDSVTFKARKDPRITPLGAWLRRSSLDELPQLINVLQGQMSLVGPRPAVPSEVIRYEGRQFQRLLVKPGITCIWQVSGRGDVDFGGQVAMDVEYVRTRSLLLDVSLMAKTIPAVLTMRGAY